MMMMMIDMCASQNDCEKKMWAMYTFTQPVAIQIVVPSYRRGLEKEIQ